MLIAEAERAGVLETGEHRMISGVLRLGDRPVRGLMTPRTDVDWIDLTADAAAIASASSLRAHSRLPVGEGSPDAIIGVVTTRELLAAPGARQAARRQDPHCARRPSSPTRTDALDALETLRDAEVPMALIHDEYGHFEGVVTPADILEAIAGVFRSDVDAHEPAAVPRDDGSWLLAGWMSADEMADQLGIALPPKRDYQTVAGFVLAQLAPPARGRRAGGDLRLALRGGRSRRPPHRQGAGNPRAPDAAADVVAPARHSGMSATARPALRAAWSARRWHRLRRIRRCRRRRP